MKKYLLSTTCLTLLLFWPTQAQEIATSSADIPTFANEPATPARHSTVAEENYLRALSKRGLRMETQGLLIESLSGSTVFADLNSSTAFNPASVIKIATSFAALDKYGPEYRFETAIHASGTVNKKTRTLTGDLIIASTGDPNLGSADISKLLRQVIRAGIVRVTGKVIVSGPLSFGTYYTTERALKGLSLTARRLGLRVVGGFKLADAPVVPGNRIASLQSTDLRSIVFFQNAYSSNPIAERLGNTLGGPNAVERFLVDNVGIAPSEVHVGRTSGLDYNRITPRGTIQLLRSFVSWLDKHSLHPEDVMPVAGIDAGTLRLRLRGAEYQGAVVAKTGTLPATDGGVSALAGVLYTRDGGTVLFAIFNTRGDVSASRRLQDSLLKGFLNEFGAAPAFNASSRKLNN